MTQLFPLWVHFWALEIPKSHTEQSLGIRKLKEQVVCYAWQRIQGQRGWNECVCCHSQFLGTHKSCQLCQTGSWRQWVYNTPLACQASYFTDLTLCDLAIPKAQKVHSKEEDLNQQDIIQNSTAHPYIPPKIFPETILAVVGMLAEVYIL